MTLLDLRDAQLLILQFLYRPARLGILLMIFENSQTAGQPKPVPPTRRDQVLYKLVTMDGVNAPKEFDKASSSKFHISLCSETLHPPLSLVGKKLYTEKHTHKP